MKIALVIHEIAEHGGQERSAYEWCRYLCGRGHEVTVFARGVAPEMLAWPGFRFRRVPCLDRPFLFRILTFWMAASWMLWRARRRREVEIIHANGAVAWPCDLTTCQFCHTAWNRWEPGMPTASRLRRVYHHGYTLFNAWLERWYYTRGHPPVAVLSPREKSELEMAGVPAERITVVPHGIGPEPWETASRREESRRRLEEEFPWCRGKFVFLTAGDLGTDRKGIGTVLAAWGLRKDPGAVLLVAGRLAGSPFPALAARLGLGPEVIFTGLRRDLFSLMAASDAFVLASCYEPFGLVAGEALACGLPVIMSDTVGIAGWLRPGEDFFALADPRSAEDLARQLTEVRRHPEQARETVRRAREKISPLTWKQAGERYEAWYRELLSPPRALTVLALDAPWEPGGIQRYLAEMLAHHPRERVAWFCLTRGTPMPPGWRGLSLPRRAGKWRRALDLVRLSRAALASLRRAPPRARVLLCGHPRLLPVARHLARHSGAELVTFTYGLDVTYRVLPGWLRRGLDASRHVVAISRFMRDFLAARGVPREKMVLISPGVAWPLPPEEKTARVAGWENALAGKIVLLTVSRLSSAERYKGQDFLLGLFPALLKKYSDLRYVVAGGGDWLPELRSLADRQGVTEQVLFTGSLSEGELSWWYRRADIFALASDAVWRGDRLWTEGFGIVLLEAAARGLPCVGGEAGGIPDALGDGKGGILLPPRDAEAWIRTLGELAGDPGKRKALGAKARAWTLAGHTWEHRRQAWIHLLATSEKSPDSRPHSRSCPGPGHTQDAVFRTAQQIVLPKVRRSSPTA